MFTEHPRLTEVRAPALNAAPPHGASEADTVRAIISLGQGFRNQAEPELLRALDHPTDALLIRSAGSNPGLYAAKQAALRIVGAMGLGPVVVPLNRRSPLFVELGQPHNSQLADAGAYGAGRPMGARRLKAKPSPEFVAFVATENGQAIDLQFIDDVLDGLDLETQAQLARPDYLVAWPEHPPVHVATTHLPLLAMHEGRMLSRFASEIVWSPKSKGSEAVEAFRVALRQTQRWRVVMDRGDVLVLRNHRVLHALPDVQDGGTAHLLLMAASRTRR